MTNSSKSNPAFGKNAVVLVHGGAGAIRRDLTPARERQCQAKLEEALKAGRKQLQDGGSSLDAVVAAVRVLEDSSLFNAGYGSCLTRAGTVEMDAAVMVGDSRAAGAVASINCVKNPVLLARAVMELSPHVMLVGPGANKFAKKMAKQAGLKLVEPDYFVTEGAKKKLARHLEEEKAARKSGLKVSGLTTGASEGSRRASKSVDQKYGTVGAVAVDENGTVAAATSTGGVTGKMPGRVGDSPIFGAGTIADNTSCAVSATGYGEFFMRGVAAGEVSALIRHGKLSLEQAVAQVFSDTLAPLGGEGGMISLCPNGDYAMQFNTAGMFRGVMTKDGTTSVAIF